VAIARLNRDLLGLDALEEVGGDLRAIGVRDGTEGALAALLQVGGALELEWTADDWAQIPALEAVGSLDLRLTNNRSLPFVWSGFGNLREVSGDLSLSSQTLHLFTGFGALEAIPGDLTLSTASAPEGGWSLEGLGALHSVGGDLTGLRLSTAAPLFLASAALRLTCSSMVSTVRSAAGRRSAATRPERAAAPVARRTGAVGKGPLSDPLVDHVGVAASMGGALSGRRPGSASGDVESQRNSSLLAVFGTLGVEVSMRRSDQPTPPCFPHATLIGAAVLGMGGACAPTEQTTWSRGVARHGPLAPASLGAGYASVSAGDPCVEAGAGGHPTYVEGCRDGLVLAGDQVISSALQAQALCLSGDVWIAGDLTVQSGVWSMADLSCVRGVDGTLLVNLRPGRSLDGLQHIIRAGQVELQGTGDGSLVGLDDLLSADALVVSLASSLSLSIAPQLSALGRIQVERNSLGYLGPRWPVRTIESLDVTSLVGLLDLDGIGDVRDVLGDVQVDASFFNLDGMQHLEHVGGDLRLIGVYPNTELSLRRLRWVEGTLELVVQRNNAPGQFPALEEVGALDLSYRYRSWGTVSLWGFDRLHTVHGDLALYANLSEISGFNALETVGGDLTVDNAVGSSVDWDATGFSSLASVGGGLDLGVIAVGGSVFPRLERVGGELTVAALAGAVHPSFPMLVEVGALNSGPSFGGVDLPALEAVYGRVSLYSGEPWRFGALERIDGRLLLAGTDSIPEGLDRLSTLSSLSVSAHFDQLELPAVETIGDVTVTGHRTDRRCPCSRVSLPALRSAARLVVANCELESLRLPALETVAGDLQVDARGVLGLLELDALEAVGGELAFSRIAVLARVDLPALRMVGGPAGFTNSGGPVTVAMPSIERVYGLLSFDDNPRLTQVEGLDQLSALGGLRFADNDRLVALPALPSLEVLDGDLVLDDNLRLEQLGGLAALREVGGAMQITGNRSLSLDEIDVLIANLDAAPSGGSTVSGNGR